MNFADIHAHYNDLSDKYTGSRVRLITGGPDNGMLGTILRVQLATIVVRRDDDKYREYAYGYCFVETIEAGAV